MIEILLLKKKPQIEFQFLAKGFELIDAQIQENYGFYAYNDIESIALNNASIPKLAKWLRMITWVLNGIPFFPDTETYKKANLNIRFKKTELTLWLTDSYMAN
tara:strand:+ start:479 stop:787 length:309 start_codon:yes stop_codon:yes gene_type:complete